MATESTKLRSIRKKVNKHAHKNGTVTLQLDDVYWMLNKLRVGERIEHHKKAEENNRLREALVVAYSHCIDDEMDMTADMIFDVLSGCNISAIWLDDLQRGITALEENK